MQFASYNVGSVVGDPRIEAWLNGGSGECGPPQNPSSIDN